MGDTGTAASADPPTNGKHALTASQHIDIPADLKPADGRFGSGPSKIRSEALDALHAAGPTLLGTSHRQRPVRQLVRRIREGLADLYDLPEGYQVVLGNGCTTAFWDIAAFGLVRERSQHLAFGEFSSKFAAVTKKAPWLDEPSVRTAVPGTYARAEREDGIDAYALTHNETSTGVMASVERPADTQNEAIVLVDATSAAG